jgi:hypothetical protein
MQPTKPRVLRALDVESEVASSIGYFGTVIYLPDYANRQIAVSERFVKYLAKKPPNHTSYIGWIPETLLRPAEVWEHADPRNPMDNTPRRYYLTCYRGVSYVAICVTDDRLINAFKITRVGTVHDYRFGLLRHAAYPRK